MAIISLSAGCRTATPLATTQSEGQVKVIKSPNDPRYHFETLPNGLKLLVISDANADQILRRSRSSGRLS